LEYNWKCKNAFLSREKIWQEYRTVSRLLSFDTDGPKCSKRIEGRDIPGAGRGYEGF
jgi:hypothetical protein